MVSSLFKLLPQPQWNIIGPKPHFHISVHYPDITVICCTILLSLWKDKVKGGHYWKCPTKNLVSELCQIESVSILIKCPVLSDNNSAFIDWAENRLTLQDIVFMSKIGSRKCFQDGRWPGQASNVNSSSFCLFNSPFLFWLGLLMLPTNADRVTSYFLSLIKNCLTWLVTLVTFRN